MLNYCCGCCVIFTCGTLDWLCRHFLNNSHPLYPFQGFLQGNLSVFLEDLYLFDY
jgi:hypothetical protein